jgi:hypothetical protein
MFPYDFRVSQLSFPAKSNPAGGVDAGSGVEL